MTIEEAAWWMLQELKEQRLSVTIVKGRRVAESQNPRWYQEICQTHSCSRRRRLKVRTYIKRCHVVRVLDRIAREIQNLDTLYAQRVIPYLERYGE